MNQTAASSNASVPAGGGVTSLLTTVHLAWIGVLALLVVVAIIYGARLKHRREQAARAVIDHAEEAGVEPRPVATPGEQAPAEAVVVAAPASTAGGPDAADGPVTQLKGLGPKVAARLAELGVTSVGQIAALDHDGAQRLDAQLGAFSGRMERDRWVEQARFLAAGDRAGFEAVFGRL